MVDEKTPTLFLNKSPFEDEEKRDKACSRFTLSWILSALLIALAIIAFIEFLYPVGDGRPKTDEDCIIKIYPEQPYEVTEVKPPVMTDYVPEKVYKYTEADSWTQDFLIDPTHLCATRNPPNSEQYHLDPEVKLLILIPSATSHFLERKAIRNTWGSIAKLSGTIRIGFVLGATFNKTEDNLIQEESSKYRDIIQVHCEDASRQFTTKNVLMLKWMAERCPHAEYFLKADDSTFVNVGTIANILGSEPFVSKQKFIGGYVQKRPDPFGILDEEYSMSEAYPNVKYPPHISGSSYVTTGPTAVELFQATNDVQPFSPPDDIFLTGLCGDYIDATLIHEPRFRSDDPPNPPSWQSLSNVATAHSISPNIMQLIWKEINESLSVEDLLLNQEAAINATVILGRKRRLIN